MLSCKTDHALADLEAGPLYHYVIVREDLPRGLQAAMMVHAAGESSPGNLPDDTHAVVLTVADESELMKLRLRLLANYIQHRAIIEPDPPLSGQLVAIGIVPARKEKLRAYLANLPLLR